MTEGKILKPGHYSLFPSSLLGKELDLLFVLINIKVGEMQVEKPRDQTSVTESEDEERWEGKSQEKMKFLQRVCGKEKKDCGAAAATVNGAPTR